MRYARGCTGERRIQRTSSKSGATEKEGKEDGEKEREEEKMLVASDGDENRQEKEKGEREIDNEKAVALDR